MKLICCDVLFRMACRAAAISRNIIDIEFTRLQSHVEPAVLRKEIQGLIDKAEAEGVYEAILLGYGLCGNSTAGLRARGRPLVIPRAHDCCTLFLGSRENFAENFGGRLSAQWSSHGYLERSHDYSGGTDLNKGIGLDKDYAALVEQYGEENAEYIWETLHPAHNVGKGERIYIDVPPFDNPGGACGESAATAECASGAAVVPDDSDFHYMRYEKAVTDEAKAGADSSAGAAQPVIQRIKGSTRLVDMLLDGEWGEDFLIVPPGMSIAALYDMEQVMAAV
jgi:hypothetical protein